MNEYRVAHFSYGVYVPMNKKLHNRFSKFWFLFFDDFFNFHVCT